MSKAGANLKVGASGNTTTRAAIVWTTPTRLLPNGHGPLVVGVSPPAGRATLRRLQRMAEERGVPQQTEAQAA